MSKSKATSQHGQEREPPNVEASQSEDDRPDLSDESADKRTAASEDSLGDEMNDDLEQLRAELDKAADRALRLQAEMENLRNRTSREMNEARRYAALPLVRDLLPVVDNVARAIEAAENAHSAEGLLEGFKMVRQQLLDVLSQHHCAKIEAEGQPFDPNLHEAILQQPSKDHPPQTVTTVTQPGYVLHDRVVRPSQVIVSSASDAEETDN